MALLAQRIRNIALAGPAGGGKTRLMVLEAIMRRSTAPLRSWRHHRRLGRPAATYPRQQRTSRTAGSSGGLGAAG